MTPALLLFAAILAASVAVGTAAGYLVAVRVDRWLIARAMRGARP